MIITVIKIDICVFDEAFYKNNQSETQSQLQKFLDKKRISTCYSL